MDGGNLFQGEKLVGGSTAPEVQRKKVVDGLVKTLKSRFEELETDILSTTKIANLPSWPPTLDDAEG